jgi:plasmid stabilization system protein ParE
VRELPIEGTPYVVVNHRLGQDILILRVFHNGKASLA